MNIEQLKESVANEFTTADILELANKCCELKKQNAALIESFETLAEVLEGFKHNKNIQNIGYTCREQLRRILENSWILGIK